MDNSKKSIYIIAAISLALIATVVYFLFIHQSKPKITKTEDVQTEQRPIGDIEVAKRPFVTLSPDTSGSTIQVSIQNMNYFDTIDYEITYLADNPQTPGEKIQRGATGSDINTKDEKNIKSAPLGTGSKGIFSADKGITEGKLTLHMVKNGIEYLSETNWDLYNVGSKASEIKDRSGNFSLKLPSLGKDYWVIVSDTVGVPPGYTFDLNNVNLPIYGIFSLDVKYPKPASLAYKVTEGQTADLYKYNRVDSSWSKIDSKLDAPTKTVNASVDSFATYVVVSSK
jgi:hypothetical protein